MQINAPDNSRSVTDYDFHFSSGQFLGVTIDESLGDTITIDDTTVSIYLSPKASAFKSDSLPAESIKFKIDKLDFHTCRTRSVTNKTAEQEVEWQKTIKDMSKAIN